LSDFNVNKDFSMKLCLISLKAKGVSNCRYFTICRVVS